MERVEIGDGKEGREEWERREREEVMVEGRAGGVFYEIKIYDYTPDLQWPIHTVLYPCCKPIVTRLAKYISIYSYALTIINYQIWQVVTQNSYTLHFIGAGYVWSCEW